MNSVGIECTCQYGKVRILPRIEVATHIEVASSLRYRCEKTALGIWPTVGTSPRERSQSTTPRGRSCICSLRMRSFGPCGIGRFLGWVLNHPFG